MNARRPYPSDVSDARWELIEPVLAAWRFERRGRALDLGRPPEHDLREIMNAILYVDRTGAYFSEELGGASEELAQWLQSLSVNAGHE
ncbi:hypothetical protein Sgleb_12380 [Streptomyces glebosus]|uniref:Insertion element IS402-like domain-containing protein n=1 Tax=Streptomyces glebosus TaxID=249580 RepID=A0A640SSF9_9ACTN|nr:hypothetical protein Sgleb_12380 [Streptomyces glebosus]GHG78631.1 hypothetical protein GCM10010513_55330 [Streptomyces glebosus]